MLAGKFSSHPQCHRHCHHNHQCCCHHHNYQGVGAGTRLPQAHDMGIITKRRTGLENGMENGIMENGTEKRKVGLNPY